MKKAILLGLFIVFLLALLICTGEKANSFFIGFGSGGAVSNTIKDGQTKGLIPIDAAPPSNLSTSLAGWTEIDLTWQNNTPGQTGVIIQRMPAGGSYSTIATAAAAVTAYADKGVIANSTYTYRLRATTAAGLTKVSNEDTNSTAAPQAPTGLSGVAASATSIALNWTVTSVNESGFYIEMAVGTGTFGSTVTVARKTSSYTWSGLLQSSPYSFRVRAFNILGNSAYSNTTLVTTSLYTWSSSTVLNLGGSALYKMAYGNGRNDGTNRIYCGSTGPTYYVYECTWTGSTWQTVNATPVSTSSGTALLTNWSAGGVIAQAIAIGNIRNDGTSRMVYALGGGSLTSIGQGYVGQIDYNGSNFIWTTPSVSTIGHNYNNWEVQMFTAQSPDPNASQNKVYTTSDNTSPRVYQAYYTTGIWKETGASVSTTKLIYSLICDSLQLSDSVRRIYGAAQNGNIYEYTWTATSNVTNFSETALTNLTNLPITTGTKLLASGPCRNDSVRRLYYAGGDGHVYELTSTAAPAVWTTSDTGSLTNAVVAVTAGNVTPDGNTNIYAATTNRDLFQISYTGGAFSIVRIATTADIIVDLQIFTGRNDGVARLYASTKNGQILEYTPQ